MKFGPYRLTGIIFAVVAAVGIWQVAAHTEGKASSKAAAPNLKAPQYRYDPDFPKPLPQVKDAQGVMRDQWTGGIGTNCLDSHDHMFQFNRGHVEKMPAAMNAVTAPPLLILDSQG